MQIISGELKGRRLSYPKQDKVRPTQAKVREAMFNILGQQLNLAASRVLDLCCGSGALGLEAYSRGAQDVAFVDIDTRFIIKNIKLLQLEAASALCVYRQDAKRFIRKQQASFDLIFFDPPWHQIALYEALIKTLCQHALWGPESILICEARRYRNGLDFDTLLPDTLSIKCYNYGSTSVLVIQNKQA
eukprot:COSAG01_NODE_1_length_100484_cov_170.446142_113_plen_188_part_00